MDSTAACALCGQPIRPEKDRSKRLHLGASGKDVHLCRECYIATGDGASEDFLEFLLAPPA